MSSGPTNRPVADLFSRMAAGEAVSSFSSSPGRSEEESEASRTSSSTGLQAQLQKSLLIQYTSLSRLLYNILLRISPILAAFPAWRKRLLLPCDAGFVFGSGAYLAALEMYLALT